MTVAGIVTSQRMFSFTDPLHWPEETRNWGNLISQRAKRTLGHKWTMNSDELARPDSREYVLGVAIPTNHECATCFTFALCNTMWA